MTILHAGPLSDGLEGWRRLTQHYQPPAASRQVGLLQSLLTTSFRADKASEWENDWLQWEAGLHAYEAEADLPLDDDVKVAIVDWDDEQLLTELEIDLARSVQGCPFEGSD